MVVHSPDQNAIAPLHGSLGGPDRNWGAFLDYTLQPQGSQFDPVASPSHITPNRVIRSLRPLRCANG
ncbi:hypothetical protein PGTUg99_035243 [Puccinia graminis f. sp. tritici]|uniref:Uncharacterized protein n=1 Tax=Puccinia graminis f. sp. tritici TaxID=56615 RepID=A0A5B0SEK5_PUCGR|nr:hypothetical protein PGTUg99_035243 [Puccinia graminis f. sp. tritici]